MRPAATIAATMLTLTACATTTSPPPATTTTPTPATTTAAAATRCTLHHATDGQDLPDPTCTPGDTDPQVTQQTINSTICVPGWTDTVRPPSSVTNKIKARLRVAYGVTGPAELDHLIPLQLGGSSSEANLWPEPGDIPNPKDTVEGRLKRAVCDGRVTLDAARRAIAADWTTAEQVLGLA